MISLLPVFGVFGRIALETLALGIISLVVKDFHVEWSSGSKIVAAGTITIIVVSFFLKIMLFSMMAALVH
jgi:membrane-bound ClpP family serine protease